MEAWFKAMRGKAKSRMIMVGDLNVAPLPTDVWSHKQLLKVVSHTPAEVRTASSAYRRRGIGST